MRTRYHLTKKSSNAKTGPIPVTTTSADTCPKSCPFYGQGCYAKAGYHLRMHWDKVSTGKRGTNLSTLCKEIAKLPEGQLWRHNQAGDLPGRDGAIDSAGLRMITDANKGRKGFTYTHKPCVGINVAHIREANDNGFTVNLSANSLVHADELAKHGLPIAAVLPETWQRGDRTPGGMRIVKCPAQTQDNMTCAKCGLCQKRNRGFVIGFEAHGAQAKAVNAVSKG
jgi:hypothetical protein